MTIQAFNTGSSNTDISEINAESVQEAIARFTTPIVQDGRTILPFISSPEWDWTIHCVDSTPSTNTALWQLLQDNQIQDNQTQNCIPGCPPVLIARTQTKGKGQWSRQWVSPPGGLYLSAVLPFSIPVHAQPILTLATACGIATVLKAAGCPVDLKWPNDLVVGGKKLGGILIESRLRGDRLSQGIIGIGMNWINPIPDTGISLHALIETQPVANIRTLSDVAALVLLGIQAGIMHWQTHGSEAIAQAYNQVLVNTQQWIPLPSDDDKQHPKRLGQIIGVDSRGHLIVRVPIREGDAVTDMTFAPGTIAIGYGQH
ncbi:MAG: biotin--[acetyl-CoA-carboxylase] ligase [Cyanobacteria bacterium P01_E01_bin.6]